VGFTSAHPDTSDLASHHRGPTGNGAAATCVFPFVPFFSFLKFLVLFSFFTQKKEKRENSKKMKLLFTSSEFKPLFETKSALI